jgi:hypothetical protein
LICFCSLLKKKKNNNNNKKHQKEKKKMMMMIKEVKSSFHSKGFFVLSCYIVCIQNIHLHETREKLKKMRNEEGGLAWMI